MNEATCTTCRREASSPYRRWNAKHEIVEGCIEEFHSEALYEKRHLLETSWRWHIRPEALMARYETRQRFGRSGAAR